MSHATIITLLILMSVAVLTLIVFFGYHIRKTVQFNRNPEAMNAQATESHEEFAVLLRNLEALNH